MNSDPGSHPVTVALREVAETKRLLEALIGASESFDYRLAKATLEELRLKVKVLGRMQAELTDDLDSATDRIIPFPAGC